MSAPHEADDSDAGHELDALRAIPPPRRTDDAFARSVAADVAQARAPRWLFVPALAAGAAAIGFFLTQPDAPDAIARAADAGAQPVTRVDVVPPPAPAAGDDGEPPVALDDVDPGLFSFPALEGSSEQELLAFERRLDDALKKTPL